MDYREMYMVPRDLYIRIVSELNAGDQQRVNQINAEFLDHEPPQPVPQTVDGGPAAQAEPPPPGLNQSNLNESGSSLPTTVNTGNNNSINEFLENNLLDLPTASESSTSNSSNIIPQSVPPPLPHDPNQATSSNRFNPSATSTPVKDPSASSSSSTSSPAGGEPSKTKKRRNVGDEIAKLHDKINSIQTACVEGLLKRLNDEEAEDEKKKIEAEFLPVKSSLNDIQRNIRRNAYEDVVYKSRKRKRSDSSDSIRYEPEPEENMDVREMSPPPNRPSRTQNFSWPDRRDKRSTKKNFFNCLYFFSNSYVYFFIVVILF